MHLAHLRLRDFRNYARLDADFLPGLHLLLGDNAQGKTNILESIYLLATLRSFRGVGSSQMIRHGQKGYFVGGQIVAAGEHEAKLYWSLRERSLSLDNRSIKKLTEYLGVLRTVVFCTEDLQLIKGGARVRRRFTDLLLSQAHSSYLPLLQRYTHALRSRNALLKQRILDPEALAGFSRELIDAGSAIIRFRRELVPQLSPLVSAACHTIGAGSEELRLEYSPGIKGDFTVELAQSRSREAVYRSTVVGPHRDDLKILLNDKLAAEFSSEGQKRTVAIGFKMAQAEFLANLHGSPPVLLIDDVMGELDAKRRSGLLPLLERTHRARGQVFMTATEENWPREIIQESHRWHVHSGALKKAAA
jgi:DNA replication and repair protein RecF